MVSNIGHGSADLTREAEEACLAGLAHAEASERECDATWTWAGIFRTPVRSPRMPLQLCADLVAW